MKKLAMLFLTIALLVGVMAMPLSVAAGGDKVTICHMPNTPDEVSITVSVNALPAHLAHGDYQGDCTHTEVLTCPFDATTIPVIGPDFVKYTIDFGEGTPWYVTFLSNTGQDYSAATLQTGTPGPPTNWVRLPGYLAGVTTFTGSWDVYIMKLNPTDANFDHTVSCAAPPP
ncbi:MAG: hypothetical protein HZB51_29225 [Chloroflexi bacterium]|nr:hypothetical protein [Chloroflexota bacterium]